MPILQDYPVFREDFLSRMMLSYKIGDYVKVRFFYVLFASLLASYQKEELYVAP